MDDGFAGGYEALGYCGIYCGVCGNFKKNENCAGCRKEPALLWDCEIRVCVMERGFMHCGECAEFPCELLNGFYHEGKASHLQAYHNMLEIIEKGPDAWLQERE